MLQLDVFVRTIQRKLNLSSVFNYEVPAQRLFPTQEHKNIRGD